MEDMNRWKVSFSLHQACKINSEGIAARTLTADGRQIAGEVSVVSIRSIELSVGVLTISIELQRIMNTTGSRESNMNYVIPVKPGSSVIG